ncbi:hypothetical protein QVA66_03840 [Staphylococcus chromogenes]|nr:hypothetical protein [Staphylococcus chromogenes]
MEQLALISENGVPACPYCGRIEVNDYVQMINHTPLKGQGMCTSQSLALNRIRNAPGTITRRVEALNQALDLNVPKDGYHQAIRDCLQRSNNEPTQSDP